MDATLKAKWVKALRSGEIKQAKGTLLEDGGAMCCLGVLATIQDCDLSKLDVWDRKTTKLPHGFNAGISAKTREALAVKNDGGSPFPEIADYIEEHL
jgi:hypothetical protein